MKAKKDHRSIQSLSPEQMFNEPDPQLMHSQGYHPQMPNYNVPPMVHNYPNNLINVNHEQQQTHLELASFVWLQF